MIAAVPYWRLSAFYLFYFAALGAFMPYWSLYLEGLGYSAAAIGGLLALMSATKIIAPNIWGWIADTTGAHMRIVRVASLAATVSFAGVFLDRSHAWLALVMVAFSFFWNASLPQFEATTLNHLGDQVHRYSRIRLWGSVGFIVAVAAMGPMLDLWGAGLVPWVVVVLFGMIWLSSLWVPDGAHHNVHAPAPSLRKVLLEPRVAGLLAVCFLMQASHGPYYGFFSIYLQDHGYTRSTIGQLWAVGVAAEVLVFIVLQRLLPAFGLRKLLMFSLGCAVLRWVLIGAGVDSIPVLLVAQLLHAATFGIYHGVAIQLFHRRFTGPLQGRGQGLYSSISFGAGGAAGALYSGHLWDKAGASFTFYLAASLSAAACLLAWYMVREEPRVASANV